MFGCQATLPLDVIYGMPEPAIQSPSEYAKVLHKQMTEAFALIRSKLATQHERQKDFYNHKVHGKPYAPGNLVWLHSPVIGKGKSRKLHHPWTGPYKVIKKLSDVTYRVQKLQGCKQRKVVHFNQLKPCPDNIYTVGCHWLNSCWKSCYSRYITSTHSSCTEHWGTFRVSWRW